MLFSLNNITQPCISAVNYAITYVNGLYSPYASTIGAVSYTSSAGLTGYGLRPIWGSEQGITSKIALTSVYGLHIASTGYALTNLLYGGDYSQSTMNALVGATAMFKSVGDYLFESSVNQKLLERKRQVQRELSKNNAEFNRNLILIEDLKDTEFELQLLKQEQAYFEDLLAKINLKKKGLKQTSSEKIQTIYEELYLKAKQEFIKQESITELRNKNLTAVSSEIQEKIVLLRQNKDETLKATTQKKSASTSVLKSDKKLRNIDEQIEKYGYQFQFCIKHKKISEQIFKINELLKQQEDLTRNDIKHFRQILNDLSSKLSLSKNNASFFSILNKKFKDSQNKSANMESWLKKYITNEISNLASKIKKKQTQFEKKQNAFSQISSFSPNEIWKDFAGMYQTMKELIDLQSQASLAAMSERSKEKSANFSLLSSMLALLICVMPNVNHTKRLAQIKNGVGFLALVVGNVDMIRKYLLSMKLSSIENKKIQQLLQNTIFDDIAKSRDSDLRDNLLHRINAIKSKMVETEDKKPQSRKLKEKANLLIFRNQDKQKIKPRTALTSRSKQSRRSIHY